MSDRACCCDGGDCCGKESLYSWPAGFIADNGRIDLDWSVSLSFNAREVNTLSGESCDTGGSFTGTGSVSEHIIPGKPCARIELTDSDSFDYGGGIIDTASVVLSVDPASAALQGPGHRTAHQYTYARGFANPLVTVQASAIVNDAASVCDEPTVTPPLSVYSMDVDCMVGFPCSSNVGFIGGGVGQFNCILADCSENAVATPFGVFNGIVPDAVIGGRGYSQFRVIDADTVHYLEVQTTLSYPRSTIDAVAPTLEFSKRVLFVIVQQLDDGMGGTGIRRTTEVGRLDASLEIALKDDSEVVYASMAQCPAYAAAVSANCAGDGDSDCCSGSLECSKADDDADILYQLTMTNQQSIVLWLDGDASHDAARAVHGATTGEGGTGDFIPSPMQVVHRDDNPNLVEPCLPPSGGHTAAERQSSVEGYDEDGWFTVLGWETLQVIPDATPDARYIELQWRWISDLVKHRTPTTGEPSAFLVARIQFFYDKTTGTPQLSAGANSSLALFGPSDPDWPVNVASVLDADGPPYSCLDFVEFFGGFIASGFTVTKDDMTTRPRLTVNFRVLFETLNLAECVGGGGMLMAGPSAAPLSGDAPGAPLSGDAPGAPAKRGIVRPTPEETKRIMREGREGGRGRGCGGCGGRSGV